MLKREKLHDFIVFPHMYRPTFVQNTFQIKKNDVPVLGTQLFETFQILFHDFLENNSVSLIV